MCDLAHLTLPLLFSFFIKNGASRLRVCLQDMWEELEAVRERTQGRWVGWFLQQPQANNDGTMDTGTGATSKNCPEGHGIALPASWYSLPRLGT